MPDTKEMQRVWFVYDEKNVKFYHDFFEAYEVEIVHYDLERGLQFPDVFIQGRRVVKSDSKTLLPGTNHTVYRKDYEKVSSAFRNNPEVIVKKAKNYIGEKKWGFFSRWSSTMANECVLVDYETYYNRGYRFARIVHAHCSDLLYAEATHSLSGVAVLDFILSHTSFNQIFPRITHSS
jgi:hypothetical protein